MTDQMAIQIHPFNHQAIGEPEYDLFVGIAGYEPRSRYIAESARVRASIKFASAFEDNHIFAFDENVRWYKSNGFDVQEQDDAGFIAWTKEMIHMLDDGQRASARVCVDVSSMSRIRVAALVDAIATNHGRIPITIDFAYSLAKYCAPARDSGTIEIAEPVLPRFAGWSNEPERPVSAIFGVGYEPEKVLGVVEYLEPSEAWLFVPMGPDSRFFDAVAKSNANLFSQIPRRRVIRYHVENVFDTMVALESLTYGILAECRPILVPFGPKIFNVVCLLVSLIHEPSVAVWRVSGGASGPPLPTEADGNIFGISATFSRSETSECRSG